MTYLPKDYPIAYSRYINNKTRHTKYSIKWELTFTQWYQFWLDYGVDKNLPFTSTAAFNRDSPCLTTIDQEKGFVPGNLVIMPKGTCLKGKTTRARGKLRPKRWIVKDPNLHRKYLPFLRARAQANFRNEGWTLTFEDWCTIWPDHLWDQRGRDSDNYAMTRKNPVEPWTIENTIVITRREQLHRTRQYQIENNLPTSGRKRKTNA